MRNQSSVPPPPLERPCLVGVYLNTTAPEALTRVVLGYVTPLSPQKRARVQTRCHTHPGRMPALVGT